jgi:methyltransferase (TIGR00027 family)
MGFWLVAYGLRSAVRKRKGAASDYHTNSLQEKTARTMSLPNLSNMMKMGEYRYIQWLCETPEYRNPDALVGALLSFRQRVRCVVRGTLLKSRLRAMPFYYYILARTRYYDEIFVDQAHGAVTCIINIGCGTDTRAYRFAHVLKRSGVTVVECDQPQVIHAKQKIARRRWPTDHVSFVPLDLNETGWKEFAQLLDERRQGPLMVMMEGVSPYVRSDSFEAFLGLLAVKLHPRSLLAYDFKIVGAADTFGCSPGVPKPFRLPAERKQIAAYHDALGLELHHMELSTDLSRRLLQGAPPLFDEDCLLRLAPGDRASSPKKPRQNDFPSPPRVG